MKTLSIRQPWASLIANGIKNIENRSWKTNYRGRIYIHVSASKFKGITNLFTSEQLNIIQRNHQEKGFPLINTLPYSAIIGEVDIVDCVLNHESIWADQMKTHKCEHTNMQILNKGQKYVWNWVLVNPVLYEKPINNVKGKLSFWGFDKNDY